MTMPRESPTRIRSTSLSISFAVGVVYAVRQTMGSPPLRARMADGVRARTGADLLTGAIPCERGIRRTLLVFQGAVCKCPAGAGAEKRRAAPGGAALHIKINFAGKAGAQVTPQRGAHQR